jgi:hypothetical protein
MITETVYLNRDNINSLWIKARRATSNDATLQDISGTSRMQLLIGQLLIDSRNSPAAFDWSTNGEDGQLDLTLGFEKGLRVGTYRSRLTIYDNNYPNGRVWGYLMIEVREN